MLKNMFVGYTPISANILDLDEAFRLAVELQLDFVELAYDLQEILPSSQPVQKVLELKKATGVGVTVHLPYLELNLASLFEGVRKVSVERMQQAFEYTASVDALNSVLHGGRIPERHPLIVQAAKGQLLKSLEVLKGPAIPVTLENTHINPLEFLKGKDELEEMSRFAGFGVCLDVGHALIEGGEEQIEAYWELSHITHLHLQDSLGLEDDHFALGRGKINWQNQKKHLEGFSGTVCLEISGTADDVRHSAAFLRELLKD
ncbi:sugar phosphate isomerase/epimerase family protein [Deinococcus cellulosilyticus]|uniref:Xylose isomerase n=1 Tax=Deinococcus cellulosilyticus (strain DSM 18568 / NBRC 106333 / KACC 11606 / 5516J-15) TaxID=1223518 RepID=A0A511NAK9_DEIC1|nr:sugar phosphate isomerase/epimerase family protein [Deinococcus cellulosilyticus]GEM49864.1 xylose isomerase [Deinococcus cellulosilyticus NBRC 106333 = KACC 11606]